MIKPQDVFECSDADTWREYWALLIMIDRYKEAPSFSCLYDFHSEDCRTCAICGTVHDTNEYGALPSSCDNDDCHECREFWNYRGITNPGRVIGGLMADERRARSAWFGQQMRKDFGTSQIRDLPKEARLSTLYALMLARSALEQRHRAGQSDSTASSCEAGARRSEHYA